MTLFQSPVALMLFLPSLLLTLLGACLKKGHTLSFFGGIMFALTAVVILVCDGTLQEVAILGMVLLALSLVRPGEGGAQ